MPCTNIATSAKPACWPTTFPTSTGSARAAAMSSSDELEPDLDTTQWTIDEVRHVLDRNLVLDARDKLNIWNTNVPVEMLESHVAMVATLWLSECDLGEMGRGGTNQPKPNPRLHYLGLSVVNGFSKLAEHNVKLHNVRRLRLYKCPYVRLKDLSPQVFPAINTLELVIMDNIQLDGPLPATLQTLVLGSCSSVKWNEWQRVGGHLKALGMNGSTLVLNDSKDDLTKWHSLQKLTLRTSDVQTAAGVKLYSSPFGDTTQLKQWLSPVCRSAQITVDEEVIQESRLKQQLLEPEMQEAYEEACLEGTQEVYSSRLMLIGHFMAGKTSLKNTLMYQPFNPNQESTVGVEMDDQTCVVDIETAVAWEKDTLDHKREFKQNVARHLQKKIVAGRGGTSEHHYAAEQANAPTAVSHHVVANKRESSSGPIDAVSPKVPRLSIIGDMHAEILDITSMMQVQDENGQKAFFVIWDFGGQQLYYTMHQTFLSRTAFYLLVMDMSKGLDDVIEITEQHSMWRNCGSPKTSRDFLDFWLKSVHTHLICRGSKNQKQAHPPVIIVCTKKDLLDKNPKRRAFQIKQYIQSIRDHLEGKPYHKHVCDIIAVSNCEAGDPEVDRLRQVIVSETKEQPHWGEERPTKWLLLADRISEERVARKENPVLTIQEVEEMAEKCGVTQRSLSAFLQFYHNLGDLVYFDEEGTDDTVILSPQWLADMFSKVITHHHLDGMGSLTDEQKKMYKLGRFSAEVAAKLPNLEDPQILIRIMERFDMLVSCDDATCSDSPVFLIPCLLKRVKDIQVEKRDRYIPSIHFKCIPTSELGTSDLEKKGFLPAGLFHRLVANCCRNKKWQHKKELMFFDYTIFDADSFCFALHMAHNGITLSVFKFRGDPLKQSVALNDLKEDMQSRIQQVLDQVFPNLLCTTFLACSCFDGSLSSSAADASTVPGFLHITHVNDLNDGRETCLQHQKLLDLCQYKVWFGVDPSPLDSTTSQLSWIGQKFYQEELDPHMTTLLSSDSYKVRDILIEKKLLSFEEIRLIETKEMVYEQNIRLYQIVLPKIRTDQQAHSVKDAVCQGLCQSSQVCPFSNQYKPASSADQDKLRSLRPSLNQMPSSDLRPVLDRLEQEEILDDHLRDEIDVCPQKRRKAHRLLSSISHMHSKAHEQFIKILRETLWWENQFGDGAPWDT